MRSWLKTLNQVLVPPNTIPLHQRLRWKIIVASSWLLALAAAIHLLIISWQLGRLDRSLLPTLVLLPLFLSNPLLLRATRRVGLCAGILCFALVGSLPVSAFLMGGLASPAILWFALAPLMAAFLIGGRGALGSVILVTIQTGVLYEFQVRGALPMGTLSEPVRLFLYWFSVSFSTAISATLAWLFARDRTETHRALEQATERLSLALKSARVGVWDWNMLDDSLVLDDFLQSLLGLDGGDFRGTVEHFMECVLPEDRSRMASELSDKARTGSDYEGVYRTRWPNGAVYHLKIRSKIYRNPDGTAVRMVGMCWDISDRVMAEAKLHEQQTLLSTIMDNLPVAVFGKDANEFRFTHWNKMSETMLGLKASDVLGKSDYDLFPSEQADFFRRKDVETMKGRRLLEIPEEPIHSQVLGEITLRTYKVPLYDAQGNPSYLLGIFENITERKRSERELLAAREAAVEAANAKSEFLANMSHEIRTPINGVIGMTGLLLDTQLNPEQRDYTETIRNSADTLLTLVNDVLDFSKVEAGKLDLELIDFELKPLVQDVVKMLAFSATKKGLNISHHYQGELSHWFKGDPGRLRQILINLVNNAIKFTSNGSITIVVKKLNADQNTDFLHFEIVDTGIGIPQSALGRMFRAFSQADASTTRRFGGTGLGLSICKHLVDLMGGSIGVESREGNGSTFWFDIPLQVGVRPVELMNDEVAPSFALNARLRILIAEDNPVNRMIAVRILEKLGCRADSAANGNEVLDALRNAPYDLVLMDCQMPEMDGYETTRLIRHSRTLPCVKIPIIAMTANALPGDREKCLAVGMDDYVSKPLTAEHLVTVIHRTLIQKKAAA